MRTLICPQCGSTNADTSASCWKCYAPLTEASPGAPASRPVVSPRSQTRSFPLPLVIVLLLLLTAGGAGTYYWLIIRPGNPAQIATDFVKAFLEFDSAKMQQLATTNSAQTVNAVGQFSMLKGMVKVEKIEPGAVTINGAEAQTTVNASVSGSNLTSTVTLVRENGVWKVDATRTVQTFIQQLSRQGGSFMLRGLPNFGGR